MFSPAEHTDSVKRRKEKKRRESSNPQPTVGVENNTYTESRGPKPTQRHPPQSPDRGDSYKEDLQDDDDLWYAKWWMFCFPDLNLENVSPKR